MAQFDPREFLRATHAHRRRKVVAVSGVFLGAVGSAVLWISLMWFDSQYLAQDRRTASLEATALGGTEMAPPILKADPGPTSSLELQDCGLRDPFGLLKPTQDLEPTKEAQQELRQAEHAFRGDARPVRNSVEDDGDREAHESTDGDGVGLPSEETWSLRLTSPDS